MSLAWHMKRKFQLRGGIENESSKSANILELKFGA